VNDYPGAVVLVSHDRHLLDACADRLWLVANGTVQPYEGDLDQYRRDVLGKAGAARMDGKPKEKRGNGAQSGENRAEMKNVKKRIRELETEIERFEREIEKIDSKLADSALHAQNPKEAAALSKTRSDRALLLAQLEEEWLAASARGEELRADAG